MRWLNSKWILLRLITGISSLSMILACTSVSAERFGASSPKVHGGSNTGASGDTRHGTLTVDGSVREFSYYVPGRAKIGKLPVVIYLHGHGVSMRHMLGDGIVQSASSKWMDVAQREGFLVIYPLGLKGEASRAKTGWNDCRRDAEGNPRSDDVAFIRKLIDFATREHNGDRSRVYVTGMSNGGHMAMRVAIEMPDVVAAVAPISALLPRSGRCLRPSIPVPILLMQGTADPISPFEGGSIASGRGEVLSARETADTWIRWNGLEQVPEKVLELQDENRSDDSRIIARIREASPGGNAVIAYEVLGAGHTEPSRAALTNRLLKRVLGKQNNDIEMAETVWTFFKTRAR